MDLEPQLNKLSLRLQLTTQQRTRAADRLRVFFVGAPLVQRTARGRLTSPLGIERKRSGFYNELVCCEEPAALPTVSSDCSEITLKTRPQSQLRD
jgi:hypothetical protein